MNLSAPFTPLELYAAVDAINVAILTADHQAKACDQSRAYTAAEFYRQKRRRLEAALSKIKGTSRG